MDYRKQRILVITLGLLSCALGITIMLINFKDNITFFYSPSEIAEQDNMAGRVIRIGGLVERNSLKALDQGASREFTVTDLSHSLKVIYKGMLPNLFREGQGVVAKGYIRSDGIFIAEELLTKHDENYMPPAVADALKKSGKWEDQNKLSDKDK